MTDAGSLLDAVSLRLKSVPPHTTSLTRLRKIGQTQGKNLSPEIVAEVASLLAGADEPRRVISSPETKVVRNLKKHLAACREDMAVAKRDLQTATHEYGRLHTELTTAEADNDRANQAVDDLEQAAKVVFVAMGRPEIARVLFGNGASR